MIGEGEWRDGNRRRRKIEIYLRIWGGIVNKTITLFRNEQMGEGEKKAAPSQPRRGDGL